MARKVHYACDIYFAITWGLVTGFNSPYPWFYAAFFVPMIMHRAIRDTARCRETYGEAWEEYERRVPYIFIPVSLYFCLQVFLLISTVHLLMVSMESNI